jgi:hypothetical protein
MHRHAVLLMLAFLLSGCQSLRHWFTPSIQAVGGECLHMRLPEIPHTFCQTDPRWAEVELGTSGCKLGSHGCLVCSTAMAATSLGVRLSPSELNERLKQHDGFQPQGWLIWNAVSRVTEGRLTADYHTRPRHEWIDSALKAGAFPVIAHPLPNGTRHWVLVVGKEGFDYLVRDPLTHEPKKPVKLSTLTDRIQAVRVIKKAL